MKLFSKRIFVHQLTTSFRLMISSASARMSGRRSGFIHKVKTILPGLCNHLLHPVAEQRRGYRFVEPDIIQRRYRRMYICPQ